MASTASARLPLSRERVFSSAVALVDAEGLGALTMRRLAEALGVEAMSLYHHVSNKEGVLDGIVEVIVGEMLDAVSHLDTARAEADWVGVMRERVLAAREVLLRHPWAPEVIESRRAMIPAVVHYYEGVLAILRRGGFSYDLAHHALHALGSRVLGFTQELFEPDTPEGDEANEETFRQLAEQLPNLVGMLSSVSHDGEDTTLGWCDDQTEFEFGLDVLLDGLERARSRRGG
ncbi:MAG TPA: TetR/AcrR family transcriptional regulator C-terminal domain-containing protein [Intrasporangium sp.]|nr:TetR/AcrR family transcriptional regulator C-terminal domain-containing protein [Intrasporangium sp.]